MGSLFAAITVLVTAEVARTLRALGEQADDARTRAAAAERRMAAALLRRQASALRAVTASRMDSSGSSTVPAERQVEQASRDGVTWLERAGASDLDAVASGSEPTLRSDAAGAGRRDGDG